MISPRGTRRFVWLAGLAWLFAGWAWAQTPHGLPTDLQFSETPPVPVVQEHVSQCFFPASVLVSPLTPREPRKLTSAASSSSAKVTPVRHGLDLLPDSREACAPSCSACVPCAGPRGEWTHAPTLLGRLCGCVYESLCCPDPCYEGHWLPVADVGLFTPAVRPINQHRLRWTTGYDLMLADRSEYFWARADGRGRGPAPPPGLFTETRSRYHDLVYAVEGGLPYFSLLLEVPYRSLDPQLLDHAAGFSDLKLGAKYLFFDCELLQVSGQLLATLPTGNANKGLGTGHVTLDPSLLMGLRIGPDTYLQAQLAEWIPFNGDDFYSGAILHTHTSLNQVVYRFRPDVALVAAAETNTFSFQDGAFTDPLAGPFQRSSGDTYVSVGPTVRLFCCDRLDLGFAASFAVTNAAFARQVYATEFRWRF